MGTRSTVKFKDVSGEVVLSVYQQYDGYLEGVGAQIATTLKKWEIDGQTEKHFNAFLKKEVVREDVKANGIHDLALCYVMDNKNSAYNMYVTSADDSQEFNYEVEYVKDLGYTVNVYEQTWGVHEDDEPYQKLIFTGTAEEFVSHIAELEELMED